VVSCIFLRNFKTRPLSIAGLVACVQIALAFHVAAESSDKVDKLVAKPGFYEALTEPPCSYVSTQHRKGFIRLDDRVAAWIRGNHNGGAIPLRHFLSAPRVINDTYGLFFYDPDGGYVSAFEKNYGFQFYGWRNGIMVVKSEDGTLWSALSGAAIEGPQKGTRLNRIPSLVTTWGHWLMLHPESTAYDLFDGERYTTVDLPQQHSLEAAQTVDEGDLALGRFDPVLGIETNGVTKAYPIDTTQERACFRDMVDGTPIAVFWYGPTETAVAFSSRLDDRTLTFYADEVSPETAPFMDKETGSRWTLAGRAVDGPLRGRELTWVSGLQCRWYAWVAEYPETAVYIVRLEN
jgi:hypothetical protein